MYMFNTIDKCIKCACFTLYFSSISRSPTPVRTRSKISILSSSTCCLEDDDEERNAAAAESMYDRLMEATCNPTEARDNLQTTTASDKIQPQSSFHLSSGSHNKDDDDKISSLTKPSHRSSFCDDLLSHFERRLSDLGPRSKYPYLQQLERSATNGAYDHLEKNVKYEGGLGVGSRAQAPLVRTKGIRSRDRRWWRYGGNYFGKDVRKGGDGEERAGESGRGDCVYKRGNGAHGGMLESESNYDTLESLETTSNC